jgi:hypothetical protein
VRSINSYRPQNQHPDGLVRYHERLAEEHREQVCVTFQAMHRRKMKPHEITVAAVVKESGVSSATIYRNDDLFALIQHANPNVQRRQAGRCMRGLFISYKKNWRRQKLIESIIRRKLSLRHFGEVDFVYCPVLGVQSNLP